jgi:toxin ParE1/3/4
LSRIRLRPLAVADLDDIWLNVAIDNVSAADRLLDRIAERMNALAEHPRLGAARPEVDPQARMLVVGDYLILYRVVGEHAEIVRVVHGARQLSGLFDEAR